MDMFVHAHRQPV